MVEKNEFDHLLTRTRGTRYKENMNFVAFSSINFELTSIKQTTLNKEGYTQKTFFPTV